MSSTILKGRLTKVEVGNTAANSDITNLVYARWNRVHDIRPAFVSATKVPDHFVQPHSWIVWEIGMLGRNTIWTTVDVSDAGGSQVAYDEDGDSTEMVWFKIFYEDKDGTAKDTAFSNGIVSTEEISLQDTEDVIVVVRGLAKYKTDE